jgi:hypothetical protein
VGWLPRESEATPTAPHHSPYKRICPTSHHAQNASKMMLLRPLRPELRARRPIEVVSARRGPLAAVLGRCWSASLLYCAAVQLPLCASPD